MALFKILKGKSANLPSNKVNGYCYVTIDEHKLYVDYTKDDGTLDRFALNAVSADQWKTARNLNGMVVNGTSNVVNYGTCSTAAATAAKVVSCSNFALITGAEITVKFTTKNTAAKPTLNVNNTGAKAIYYRGSAISAGYLAANRTYTFRYNGSQYDLVGDINTDTNTKVTQTVTTSDASYPLLLAPSGQTATATTTSYFDSGVTLNPSTNTITVNISGNAATATKATQDGNGNIISSTYLPLSAGENKKLAGPLGLTENINYGTSLPDNGFDGQLFFLEDDSPSLPVGGTVGQVLTKNSSIDGDAGWATDIVGNAATATKLKTARTISLTGDVTGSGTFDGSSNLNISTTVADDSHNHTGLKTISLTGGNANTPGWRLIGSWTVSTWMNERANFIINSRHTGNGLLSIAYGCNSGTIDNTTVYCDIVISGNTHNKAGSIWNSNAFKGYFNSTNSKLYLFWYYNDYNSTDLMYFGSPISDFTPAESTWVETIDGATYGTQISTLRRSWNEGDAVTGAVWNDYAEYRESDCEESGYVLMETGDDSLTKTTERLSHFAGVSSDTWGFSQGKTARARTPIAVAGRVLVYPYQDRNNYKPGDCVCAAPGGTVDIMTREEVREWPDRIVGTVSCVPNYEEWGGGEGADRDPVKINGRIWIKVR